MCLFKHFLFIFWFHTHFSHLVLGCIPLLYPLSFLGLGKKIDRDHIGGNFLCGRLLCTGYGELFSQTDSCQPPVNGRMLSSSGCTLAAGEHKIPSVWLLGKDLMYTYTVYLGWLWLSGLPSAFGSQSEKEQATLETFCYEKEFGIEELMRAVEKEYCGVLGTAPVQSCRRDGIMDWMWNQVICIWFGFSLVGVERGLFFLEVRGMKMSNPCMVQIMGGQGY